MPTPPEIERLKNVYRSYRESEAFQRQWDKSNPGNRAILQERQRAVRRVLDVHDFLPLGGRKVLEVGCGTGGTLAGLLELEARPEDLYGVDLLADRIATAKQSYPGINFQCANAEQLDFPDSSFDLVLLFTVFSSILDVRMAQNAANEVSRVLLPGGAVLWYDFRYDNPRNPNVRGMKLKRIRGLFPGMGVHLRSLTPLPPIVRRLSRLTPLLYPLLAALPPLRTHYIGLLVKPR